MQYSFKRWERQIQEATIRFFDVEDKTLKIITIISRKNSKFQLNVVIKTPNYVIQKIVDVPRFA